MMGRKIYHPKPVVMVDIESLIPANHLLRKIDKVLNLSFIRDLAADLYSPDQGRPSVDPEVYFRIQLLLYLYNISSERKVCEELKYNLAYRWFCKYTLDDVTPDHSSLTRIRERLGEATFEKIFKRIVRECKKKGLIQSKQIMADGSLVRANAAVKLLVKRKPGDTIEKIRRKKPLKLKKGVKRSNEVHVSRTDPEAKLAGKTNEQKRLTYKVHNIADRKTRVILDTHVTDGAVLEGKIFLERLKKTESTYRFKTEDVTADRGYGYGENLQALEKRKIKSFVPNFHKNVGENYDPKLFTYDRKHDRFICPKGYFLTPTNIPTSLALNQQIYRITNGQCRTCPLRSKCFPKQVKDKSRKRICRNIYWEVQAKTKRREKTKLFRAIQNQRHWKMEGLFGEAKVFHGLNRARYRLRANMQIQAYMTASVQNIKRLLKAVNILLRQFFIQVSGHDSLQAVEPTWEFNYQTACCDLPGII